MKVYKENNFQINLNNNFRKYSYSQNFHSWINDNQFNNIMNNINNNNIINHDENNRKKKSKKKQNQNNEFFRNVW